MAEQNDQQRLVLIPFEPDPEYMAEIAVIMRERREFERREKDAANAAIERFRQRLLGRGSRIVLPS